MGKKINKEQKEDRVLLIEPDPEKRTRFERMFREEGWRVEASAEDGILPEEEEHEAPEVILVGAGDEKAALVELIQKVRSGSATARTPVVVLSDQPNETVAIAALKEGADDIAAAPFTKERLVARARAHVRLARLRREEKEHVPRAFEQLRLSERRYRSLVSATAAIVWIAAEDGRVIEEMSMWEEFTGQSWDDYREFGWLDVVHPEDRDSMRRFWREALKNGKKPGKVDFRLRRSDGEYRHIHLNAVPVRNKKVHFVEWIGAATDITRRRQAEEALREREERLRLILESSTDYAIFTTDLEGKVATWNAGAERLLGYEGDEICGTDFHRIFIREDIEDGAPDEEMRKALESGRGTDQRWHVRKDGSYFWADGLMMPLREKTGKVRGFLKIVRDSTEQKKAQDELHALTEELEERVKERTKQLEESRSRLRSLVFELNKVEQMERQRIAAELHDGLAQLLTAARLSLEGVARQVKDPEVPPVVKKVQDIISEATRATRSLMTDLSGPRVLEHDDLGVTLQWVVDRMAENGFTVHIACNESEILMERDVLTLLFQAVRELLLNVQKHAGVSEASVRVDRRPDHIEIEVSDEGRGFDPSQKLGKPGREGGFGLLNVHERLRWLGGQLDIQSAPAQGTRATVSLPLEENVPSADVREVAATPERTRRAASEAHRTAVLLVDDHLMVREGFRSVIEDKPDICVVGEAADGIEALEKARELQPDVVVMDINMPRMNGLDATRRLLEEMPDVKVIALSLHGHGDMEDAAKKAGAVAYVSKEEAFDTLCEVIRAECRNHSDRHHWHPGIHSDSDGWKSPGKCQPRPLRQ